MTTNNPEDGNGDGVVDIKDAFANIPEACPLCGGPVQSGGFIGEEEVLGCSVCEWPNRPKKSLQELAEAPGLTLQISRPCVEVDPPTTVFEDSPIKVEFLGCGQNFPNKGADGGQVEVVKDITFSAQGNQTVAILGPSGCGKSTLLRMVSGMHPRGIMMPTVGECRINDEVVDRPHDDVLTVFQTPVLAGWLSILGNVKLAFKVDLFRPRRRWPWEVALDILISITDRIPALALKIPCSKPMQEIERRAIEIIKAVGLEDVMHQFPHQLSGGQRQRAALATTLVVRPKIMCMDEPFSALDPASRVECQQLLGTLKSQYPCLTLFVTHDVAEAVTVADRIVVLSTRPATVVGDFQVPQGLVPGSPERQSLEMRIHHLLHEVAGQTGGHGTLSYTV